MFLSSVGPVLFLFFSSSPAEVEGEDSYPFISHKLLMGSKPSRKKALSCD